MPDLNMLYEQLDQLRAPSPCAHVVENCMWKEQAIPLLENAYDQIEAIEIFKEENNEMLVQYLGKYGNYLDMYTISDVRL